MSASTGRWPTELRLKTGRKILAVSFDDGLAADLPAELLRVYSPSAEVQGHGAEKPKLVLGKKDVQINAVERVGSYAVRLVFDDGHDSGFYTWSYLEEFAQSVEAKRKAYDEEAAAAGL